MGAKLGQNLFAVDALLLTAAIHQSRAILNPIGIDYDSLLEAVHFGDLELVPARGSSVGRSHRDRKLLLQAGARPNFIRWSGTTALYWAVQRGSLPMVDCLLAAGATVAAELDHDSSSLHAAAEEGCLPVLQRLLVAGEIDTLDRIDYISRTPLTCAVQACCFAAAQVLIDAGADVNARDHARNADTGLHRLVSESDEGVAFLLRAGADPHIPGGSNYGDAKGVWALR